MRASRAASSPRPLMSKTCSTIIRSPMSILRPSSPAATARSGHARSASGWDIICKREAMMPIHKLSRATGGLLAGAALVAAGAFVPMAAAGDRPVVHAPAGTVSGETRGGIRAFKGLPYARPPVGDERWQPPAPSAPWQGVRVAVSLWPAVDAEAGTGEGGE